jgi:hypothetical protein
MGDRVMWRVLAAVALSLVVLVPAVPAAAADPVLGDYQATGSGWGASDMTYGFTTHTAYWSAVPPTTT